MAIAVRRRSELRNTRRRDISKEGMADVVVQDRTPRVDGTNTMVASLTLAALASQDHQMRRSEEAHFEFIFKVGLQDQGASVVVSGGNHRGGNSCLNRLTKRRTSIHTSARSVERKG